MSQPAAAIAATLSSVLTLLRAQPPRREDQARAFKAFLKALGDAPLDLRVNDAGLELSGLPVTTELPGVGELVDHLRGHGIASIRLPGGLAPASVLSVLRALSSPVGRFDSVEHLLADIDPDARQLVHIGAIGEEGGEQVDQASGFIAGDEILHGSATRAAGRELTRIAISAVYRGRSARKHCACWNPIQWESMRRGGSNPSWRAWTPRCAIATTMRVVSTAAEVARLEREIPDGELKRTYQIAIRRMLPSKAVEHIAKLTGGPRRQEALEVLKYAGADASETLLHELVESESMEQRRALYNALRLVNTASPLLGRLLLHDEWFVVRNVAELCGDLRAEDTVPQLARHVNHGDERVRRAVAGALAKIGTSIAVEPLRQMLRDPSPQVRLQAVQGLDGTTLARPRDVACARRRGRNQCRCAAGAAAGAGPDRHSGCGSGAARARPHRVAGSSTAGRCPRAWRRLPACGWRAVRRPPRHFRDCSAMTSRACAMRHRRRWRE